jgi:hypothetical protein
VAGQVARLLTHLWGQRSGYVFLPRKAGTLWIEGTGTHHWPMDLSSLVVPATQNVYFCPLVFSQPKRLSQYALPTACLWSDLDLADPAQLKLRPSVAWKTTQGGYCENHLDDVEETPRWQALWLLDRDITPDAAAELSRRIAYAEGADKGGWDVTQVLRLPGTYNHKHAPPQRIEMLWAELRLYNPSQIALVYPRVEIPHANGAAAEWPVVSEESIIEALRTMPVGAREMLNRNPAGADRSMELLRIARTLLKLNVPRDVLLHLLERSSFARAKFEDRHDGRKVLLQTVQDAASVRRSTSK